MAIVAVLALSVAAAGGACSSSDGGSSAPSTSAAATTSTFVGTTTTEPSTAVGAAELCDDAVLEQAGPITDGGLSEISGVVASRDQPGVLWVHNDSGHPNEVWAIDHEGAVLGRFTVTGARSIDWEDIGLGAGTSGSGSDLFIGDIGDNAFTPVIGSGLDPRSAANPAVIYRVPEPEIARALGEKSGVDVVPEEETTSADGSETDGASAAASGTEPAVAFPVAYADGPRDAEALLADPETGDVFVISKQWDRSPTGLYRLPADTVMADAPPAGITTMERVADVAGPNGAPGAGPGLITGADISADGTLVALRTYGSVILWDRDLDQTLAETLVQRPTCTRKIDEPQGEAVAFGMGSLSVVTISEGEGVPLNWLSVPAG